MEFKIKLKLGSWILIFFTLFITAFGGFVLCAGMYDPKDPVSPSTQPILMIVGMLFVVMSGFMLFEAFKSMSRSSAEIDIDSFTEAEIHDKVEERWQKIKEQVNSHKPPTI